MADSGAVTRLLVRRSDAHGIPLPATETASASPLTPVTGIATKAVNACTQPFSEQASLPGPDFVTPGLVALKAYRHLRGLTSEPHFTPAKQGST